MNLCFLVLCLLLFATSCSANKGVHTGLKAAAGSQSVTLQPWLVGLTAVVVFLFIVFIALIIRRLVKKKGKDKEGWDYDKAVELDGGDSKQTSL
ncbi:Small integral membrane protein 24 Precursor [Channa argus]|uniref:Small integral membrane protein 24 n=1 Tax=Channa argus TaxID=215402 RepID=A0A6G1PM66_CHAAH|nr:Small integral membrane protein 24 Precursor [Channa argus]